MMEHWLVGAMAALGLAILAVSLKIYGRLLGLLRAGRGKVRVEALGFPELLVAVVLFTWLGGMVLQSALHPGRVLPMTDAAILQSTVLFGLVVAAIVGFLRMRGISVTRLFGLRPARPLRVLGLGVKLFLTALPLVFLCSLLVHFVMGQELEQQEIVEYFAKAARHSDWWRVAFAGGMAVVAVPMTEEFIFRGFFYGVLRKYLGAIPAMLLTSALFASIHMNLPVFLPLFVLAICFTLAYETTGSLWTSMLMHALFNASMLGLMFYAP